MLQRSQTANTLAAIAASASLLSIEGCASRNVTKEEPTVSKLVETPPKASPLEKMTFKFDQGDADANYGLTDIQYQLIASDLNLAKSVLIISLASEHANPGFLGRLNAEQVSLVTMPLSTAMKGMQTTFSDDRRNKIMPPEVNAKLEALYGLLSSFQQVLGEEAASQMDNDNKYSKAYSIGMKGWEVAKEASALFKLPEPPERYSDLALSDAAPKVSPERVAEAFNHAFGYDNFVRSQTVIEVPLQTERLVAASPKPPSVTSQAQSNQPATVADRSTAVVVERRPTVAAATASGTPNENPGEFRQMLGTGAKIYTTGKLVEKTAGMLSETEAGAAIAEEIGVAELIEPVVEESIWETVIEWGLVFFGL